MRLALAQYSLDAEIKINFEKVSHLMNEASRQGAQLIIFPELCLSPFFPQFPGKDASQYLMKIEDEYIQKFQAMCRQLKLSASPNFYLQQETHCFDASLMINTEGEIQGISKMVHIAQVPGFYEQDYYAPSDTGFRVYETSLGRIGIVVCFDRHYPESARTCSLRGAQLIIIPTANTIDEPRDLFECEVRTTAMQNGVYVAMCNRVGTEGRTAFSGESIVVDSNGNVVFKAKDQEELGIVDLDLSQVEISRRSRPYLSLRRPKLYQP